MDSDEIVSTSSEEEDLFDVFNLRKSPVKLQKTYSRSTRRNEESSTNNSYSYKNNRGNLTSDDSPSSKRKRTSQVRRPRQKRYYNKTKSDDEDDDDLLDIQVPPIFKDAVKSQKVYEQHQQVKKRIADRERLEESRLQQRETRLIRLMEELNHDEENRYDLEQDRSYLEKLLAKDEKALDGYGIPRHFYSLRNTQFDENLLPNHILNKEISQSLQFLIARDLLAAYAKVKTEFKLFFLKGLCSTNPRFLQNLCLMVLLHKDPIFNKEEFEDLLLKIGLDPELLHNEEKAFLKVERKKPVLNLQLERLNVLFTAYLRGSTEVDFAKVTRYFLLVVSDYNANKHELQTLTLFVQGVFPLLCAKIENVQDLVSQILNVMFEIETSLPNQSDKEKIKKMDLELHYNIIKLINVICGGDEKIRSVVDELNLQYLLGSDYRNDVHRFTKQNIVYHIANKIIIEDNVKDLLELNDLPTANKMYSFYYKVKILPFVLVNPFDFTLDREKNIKILRSIKSSVDRILQSCYGLIRDLGSINVEIVMTSLQTGVDKFSFNREEMVRFLTDLHQDLSLQCDKLENDLKLVNQDFFYG
ncbi:hypothetical protein FOB58_003272 [Candida parapsilosis]|uniref:Uncharacterized protein n=2 Tax=Candida parapsilosis TaxID=5480 RepID=G8B6H8_CANPC|nr:uncharacterized protein CPAR2_100980 [Candida parapsilosis]KAF6048038.1 hypothetical protein FOB59_003081 [Candida parapsilosis]KAF6049995.1 hypothetical protein FOB58_003272 [Candida parapsilosis]KAF6057858.1 hypothetical protein FOB60_002413 [Candida parapsilosis]KAF6065435.1 hypothetical protein FOB61_001505 [Candida parapsilosis]KAI5903424.1 hypothetical protein K4G60_g2579 [Candida parapsilosis]